MTCYGWLLFRATSLEQVVHLTGLLLVPSGPMDWQGLREVLSLVAPLLAVQVLQWHTKDLYFIRHLLGGVAPLRVVCYSVLVYMTLFLGGQPQSFLYFQF